MNRTILLSLAAALALPLLGQNSDQLYAHAINAHEINAQKIYAQKLVDDTMAKHPDILILAMHVKSPKDPNYPIIAWGGPTGGKVRIGKKADEDDMRVVNTGKDNLEIGPTGDRFEVELRLLDKPGKNLGALGVVYNYKPGDDKAEFKRKAEEVRDELRAEIPSGSRLFDSGQ